MSGTEKSILGPRKSVRAAANTKASQKAKPVRLGPSDKPSLSTSVSSQPAIPSKSSLLGSAL